MADAEAVMEVLVPKLPYPNDFTDYVRASPGLTRCEGFDPEHH